MLLFYCGEKQVETLPPIATNWCMLPPIAINSNQKPQLPPIATN